MSKEDLCDIYYQLLDIEKTSRRLNSFKDFTKSIGYINLTCLFKASFGRAPPAPLPTVDYLGQFCSLSKVPIDLIEDDYFEINRIGFI